MRTSEALSYMLAKIGSRPELGIGMRMMAQREVEFASTLEMQLTGVALDAETREYADTVLDEWWNDSLPQSTREARDNSDAREVIIGAGFHAAVYSAVRVLNGFPKPLVLERESRVGGTFAMSTRPTFRLNSHNRRGLPGLGRDRGANLNYLPGAPIQACNVSMMEYQTNVDMAFVIRTTLAQYAEVMSNVVVTGVECNNAGTIVVGTDNGYYTAGRIIDARGLGDPVGADIANGTTVLTFPQFIKRMDQPWPLRGLRRVAVVGDGNSATCAIESLLGLAPQPFMAAAALDTVDRVDVYAPNLPDTCELWTTEIRGRYQAIGRYLVPDDNGVQRLKVIQRRAEPVAIPGSAVIEGRGYDLVVLAIGCAETDIPGLEKASFSERMIVVGGEMVAALSTVYTDLFRIGPHAGLDFSAQERDNGVADIPENRASMFRTATKTAALAATLREVGSMVEQEEDDYDDD